MRCTAQAGLRRLQENRVDRLRKALQAVDNGDADVLDATIFQLVHDPQPEFGAFEVLIQRPRISLVPSGVTPSAT